MVLVTPGGGGSRHSGWIYASLCIIFRYYDSGFKGFLRRLGFFYSMYMRGEGKRCAYGRMHIFFQV